MSPTNEEIEFEMALEDGSQTRSHASLTLTYETAKNKWRCVVTLPGVGEKTRCFGPARSNIREAVSYMLIKYEGRISPEERGRIQGKARALQMRRCGVDDLEESAAQSSQPSVAQSNVALGSQPSEPNDFTWHSICGLRSSNVRTFRRR